MVVIRINKIYDNAKINHVHCLSLHLWSIIVKNFNMMSNSDNFFWLLNCENDKIIQEPANFVHMSLDQ